MRLCSLVGGEGGGKMKKGRGEEESEKGGKLAKCKIHMLEKRGDLMKGEEKKGRKRIE